jgi:hypothetical protein
VELEPRRVLSGHPAACLSASHELFITAGPNANNGPPDTFMISRNGSQVQVTVDGQQVYAGDLSGISKICVEGSANQDILVVNFSGGDPLPSGGLEFDAGTSPQGAPDTLVLQRGSFGGQIDAVTYDLAGGGAGSVQVSLGGPSGETLASISFSGVGSIRDFTGADHVLFQTAAGAGNIQLAGAGQPGSGLASLATSAGLSVEFDDPQSSLTISTVDPSAGGTESVDISSLVAEHPMDLVVQAAGGDPVTLEGAVNLDGGNLSIAGGVVDLTGSVNTGHGQVDLSATSRVSVASTGQITDPGGNIQLQGPQIDFAGTLSAAGGEVVLDAGAGGALIDSGAIDVSNLAAGRSGGSVRLSAGDVQLVDAARIDASGMAGGGQVLIGGSLHGMDTAIPNASDTYVGSGVVIRADALAVGDGGTVVVWSDQSTTFLGTISAVGGPAGGSGGFTEVSSKQELVDQGFVNLAAPAGAVGTLLLDPATIVIDQSLAAQIVGQLDSANVALTADVIYVEAPIDAGGASGTSSLTLTAPTIDFSDGANLITDGGNLTLQGDVLLNDGATVLLSTGPAGGGRIDIQGNVDPAGAGSTSLSLQAAGGTIDVAGAVGDAAPLGTLAVLQSGSATFAGPVSAASIVLAGTSGAIVFRGNVTAGSLTTAANDYSLEFDGAANTIASGTTFLNAGGVTLGSANPVALSVTNGGLSFDGPVTVAGTTTLSAAGGDVQFSAPLDLQGNLTIRAGGNILFQAEVISSGASARSLELSAGGDIDFFDNVGAGTGNTLGAVTIDTAGNVTFQGFVDAASLTQHVGFGTTTLAGDVTTTGPAGVDLSANQTVLEGVTITASGGDVRFGGPVNLTGDVAIASGGNIAFDGVLTSSGGAAAGLTLTSSANIDFYGAVGPGGDALGPILIQSAAGVSIDSTVAAASLVQLAGSGTTTLGGDVATTAPLGVDITAGLVLLGNMDLTTNGGGGARFNGPVDLVGDVSINAAGPITFLSTLDSPAGEAHDLSLASQSDIQFLGDVGASPGGVLGAITIAGAVDVTASGAINAGSLVQTVGFGTTTLAGDVTTTAAAGLDLSANQVVLDALTITAAGGCVHFGGPVDLAGNVEIDAAGPIAFDSLLVSWNGAGYGLTLSSGAAIRFGAAVGAGGGNALGTILIQSAVDVTAGSTIDAASLVQLSGSGTTELSGNVTTSDWQGVDLTTGQILLGGLTITAGGAGSVQFNAPVYLVGNVGISAGGSVDFQATLDSPAGEAHDLVLASAFDIGFGDAVGAGPGNALGAITIASAENVTASSTVNAASLDQEIGSGTTTLAGNVTTTTAGGVNITASQIVLGGAGGPDLLSVGGLGRFDGPVELASDVRIDSSNGQIVFTSVATIDSAPGRSSNLTLAAGAGSVSFGADIGSLVSIGNLIVERADGGVSLGSSGAPDDGPVACVDTNGRIDLGSLAVIAGGITLDGGDGATIQIITAGAPVRLNGPVLLASSASIDTSGSAGKPGAEILFTASAPIDSPPGENNDLVLAAGTSGTVSFNANIGMAGPLGQLVIVEAAGVSFGNDPSPSSPDLGPVGTVRADGDPASPDPFAIDVGSQTAIGSDGVSFNGGAGGIDFVTSAAAVRFNGPVTLQSNATIDTSDYGSDAGAEILFTLYAPINGRQGQPNTLVLTAGTDGTVSFNANIGTAVPLGQLIVTEAAQVALGNEVSDANPDLAPLGIVRADGNPASPDPFALDFGSQTAIGPGGITLDAGAGNTLSLVTLGGPVRFNGPVELESSVRIDTTGGGGAPGAEILFTVNAPVDSQPGGSPTLILTAGADGVVSFNADIGANAALGRLVVTSAGQVALGNAPDPSNPDLGPVGAVWIEGDPASPGLPGINVGSQAAIGSGGITLDAGSGNTLSLLTTAVAVRLNGPVYLGSDASIDTTAGGIAMAGADILIDGTIDGTTAYTQNLCLVAHNGAITVTGAVGGQVPLGTLSLQDDQPQSTGPVEFQGAVYAASLATVSQPYAVGLLGGGEITNFVEFLNTGGVTLGDSAKDVLTFDGGVTSVASDTSIGGTVQTPAQEIQLATVYVIADARLDTTLGGTAPTGADIVIQGTVDGQLGKSNDLELAAGSGTITFQGNVGAQFPLGGLQVDTAGDLVLGSDAWPVQVVAAFDGIDLGAGSPISGGIQLDGGALGLSMSTVGGAIRLNGAVELQSNVSINTSDDGALSGAGVLFTANAPVNSQTGAVYDLVLSAGTNGVVSFNANLGDPNANSAATGPLGQLLVTQARGVAFGNDPGTNPDLAPVTMVRVVGDPASPDPFAIDLGTIAPIGDGRIRLNAGNGNLISLVSTGQPVRFNGAVLLQSDAAIDTTDSGQETGAEIRFTLGAPIDSQAGENNGLILTAGPDGTVSFNGNIGADHPLGHLIVTDAAAVMFGSDDLLYQGLPDGAPISTVRVARDPTSPFAIDIGSVAPIGPGGILLDGGNTISGAVLTLSFLTTGGAVRFNGAVELQSDALVNTAAGSAAGAEIRFTHYATIDSQAGENNNLTLSAGTGQVDFSADIGSVTPLGLLLIERADRGVRFGTADQSQGAAGDNGPVAVVDAANGINVGSTNVITGGIVFNAGTNAGVEQQLSVQTDGGNVRLNGPVVLASNLAISTIMGGSPGGNVLFTNASPVNSQSNKTNYLLLSAGSGGVSFNNNIGGQQPLAWLAVTQADGGVVFGGADASQGTSGDLGPVGVIDVVSYIDLGTQAVISGGITFDAGPGQVLTTTVTAGYATLNGPVWLNSDLSINTAAGNGNITFGPAPQTVTQYATIDSRPGQYNMLQLYAGTGGVFFDGNVGAVGGPAWSTSQTEIGELDVYSSGNIVTDCNRVLVSGAINLTSSGAVTINEVTVAGSPYPQGYTQVDGYSVTVHAGGLLTIQNDASFGSATGRVSNAPPLLWITPPDPNLVLTPGGRTQTITGVIGGGGPLGGNLELGTNFTLYITFSDGVTVDVPNLHAGEQVYYFVDENGQGLPVISGQTNTSGPITFTVQRQYSIDYLSTVTNFVWAKFTLYNDYTVNPSGNNPHQLIQLFDERSVSVSSFLNQASGEADEKLSGNIRSGAVLPSIPPPAPIPAIEQTGILPEVHTVPPVLVTLPEFAQVQVESAAEEARIVYVVRVLPDGEEGAPQLLPDNALANLAALFEQFRVQGLPNGRYRIYLKETRFPPRRVIEFYKSGDSFGDPVRERAPGSNPLPEPKPTLPPGPAPNRSATAGGLPPTVPGGTLQARHRLAGAAARQAAIGERLGTAASTPRSVAPRATADPAAGPDGPMGECLGVGAEKVPAPSAGAKARPGSARLVAAAALALTARRRAASAPLEAGRSCVADDRWVQRVDDALKRISPRAFSRAARLRRRKRSNLTRLVKVYPFSVWEKDQG